MSVLTERFDLGEALASVTPSYNIAPTQHVATVLSENGKRKKTILVMIGGCSTVSGRTVSCSPSTNEVSSLAYLIAIVSEVPTTSFLKVTGNGTVLRP